MSDLKRTNADIITLGSGKLMIKEYDPNEKMPVHTDFTEENLLGDIQGGASIEYKGTWYEAKDDTGQLVKIIITEEEVIFKTGIIAWNGKTLEQLCSTAKVTEDKGLRTVKIGGVGNYNGKSYVLCFHHSDKVDGDIWLLLRAVNQGGFSLSFAKDKETVIDAEYKCLPQDKEGTLIQYIEEIGTTGTSE